MEAAKDHYNLVYMIYFYLSIGMLLPWNFFINVNGYWMYKFRTVNATDHHNVTAGKNELQLEFTADLAIAAMVPNVTLLILNGLFGHRFKIFPRLMLSLICIILLFSFTLGLVKVNTDSWQREFLGITLVTVVLINVFNGIFQGGLFGLAGMFPSKYMNSILTGQGLGGVFAAVINLLLLALVDDDVNAAFFCFLLSVIFLTGSAMAFLCMSRTAVFKHYTTSSASNTQAVTSEKSPLLPNSDTTCSTAPTVSVVQVIKSIWEEELTVFIVFLVTLACFPAVTVLIESADFGQPGSGPWANFYFQPVACFLFFNIGDYIGRTISAISCVPKPGSKLGLLLAIVRIVFIPLFMMCNAAPRSRYLTPVLIHSDAAYIVVMFLFSISNGFLTSVVMVTAPGRVAPHLQETAANLMAGILGVGLAAGAALSAVLIKLL